MRCTWRGHGLGRPCGTSPTRSACPRRWCRWCSARLPGPSDGNPRRGCSPPPRSWATASNRTAALMTARRSHHIGVTINIRNSFHTEIAERHRGRRRSRRLRGGPRSRHPDARRGAGDRHPVGLPLRGPSSSRARVVDRSVDHARQAAAVVWSSDDACARTRSMSSARPTPRGIGTVVDHLVGLGHRRDRARLRRARRHRRRSPKRLPACDAQTRLGRSAALSSRETSPSPRESLRHNRCLPICRQPWCAPTTASQSALSTRCVAPELTCPERYQ